MVRLFSFRKYLFVCLLLNVLVFTNVKAQSPLIANAQAENFQVDRLGNIYLITSQNELIKYDPSGQKKFTYTENTLGELRVLDVQQPLEIVLYYPDFQIIKILDRTLSEIQVVDLSSLNRFQISSIASSSDGNIWVFDQGDQQLLKIDRTGRLLYQSKDLRSLGYGNLIAQQIVEYRNQVYLHFKSVGVLQFDNYGNWIKTFSCEDCEHFQVVAEKILWVKPAYPNAIQALNLKLGTTTSIDLKKPFDKALFLKGKWLLLEKDKGILIEELR